MKVDDINIDVFELEAIETSSEQSWRKHLSEGVLVGLTSCGFVFGLFVTVAPESDSPNPQVSTTSGSDPTTSTTSEFLEFNGNWVLAPED